jgi:hypothetical protein
MVSAVDGVQKNPLVTLGNSQIRFLNRNVILDFKKEFEFKKFQDKNVATWA